MDTLQPTSTNTLEREYVTESRMQKLRDNKALEFMHKLRHETFEQRCRDSMGSVKPYLPMLESDEKELINEQYDASKK